MSRYHVTSVDFRDQPALRLEYKPRSNGGVELLIDSELSLMLSDAQVSQLRNTLMSGSALGHAQECGEQS